MGKRPHSRGVAATVRGKVLEHPRTYWRPSDFKDLPPTAVAQTFVRLADQGFITRVAKGVYYVPGSTVFGSSVPTVTDIAAYVLGADLQPAGLTAANVLGLTTQNAARGEYATTRSSRPSVLRGSRVFTGRSSLRQSLSSQEGALLEVLRNRAQDSDVDSSTLAQRLIAVVTMPGAFARLCSAAQDEPPRVRAMLGALGQEAGIVARRSSTLRGSLNPLSRFDFGALSGLRHAREWQAQ